MAASERFYLKDKYTYLNQEMMNVYFYYQLNGSSGAGQLAGVWADQILMAVLNTQVETCIHHTLEVINVDDLNDFYVLPLTGTVEGSQTGEGLPAYNAWGFTLNRASRLTRSGFKRIGGVAENNQGNGIPNAPALANLDALAALLSVDLVQGGDEWTLAIPVIGPPPGNDPPATGFISTVTFTRMTTQNSRKR